MKFLIIGTGPAGLGAAWYLAKKGIRDWLVLEKEDYPGGLSASFTDESGFYWDLGGHVLFDNNSECLKVAQKILGNNLVKHKRRAAIYFQNRFIPYPFQDNLNYLPKDILMAARSDLAATQGRTLNKSNFKDWLYTTFGKTLADIFFIPQNAKSWSYPLEKMSFSWIDKRIKLPELASTRLDLVQIKTGWGGNASFWYPKTGGIGYLWEKIAKNLRAKIKFANKVVAIDFKNKLVVLASGEEIKYQYLLSTMPLDLLLVALLRAREKKSDYKKQAAACHLLSLGKIKERLGYNRGFIIGLGIKGKLSHNFHWLYYPDKAYPFYRLVFPSNFSPALVRGYCSILAEISLPENKQLTKKNQEQLVSQVIQQVVKLKQYQGKVISVFTKKIDYFYPVPTLDRDQVLEKIQHFLNRYHIYSLGRFGGWQYEQGNMDNAFFQGKIIINKLNNT